MLSLLFGFTTLSCWKERYFHSKRGTRQKLIQSKSTTVSGIRLDTRIDYVSHLIVSRKSVTIYTVPSCNILRFFVPLVSGCIETLQCSSMAGVVVIKYHRMIYIISINNMGMYYNGIPIL